MNNSSTQSLNYFGIVSPCSTCKNQRAEPDQFLGLPACPRRVAQTTQAELSAANQSLIQISPLVLTGNEDTTGSQAFTNPVYSSELNSLLVWVATIVDNPAKRDANGNVINPDLLDPGFDTNYINCREKPVTPMLNEANYRTNGAWAEKDQLSITIFGNQQNVTTNNNTTQVLLNGFANRVNFAYSAPRVPAERDYSISGT